MVTDNIGGLENLQIFDRKIVENSVLFVDVSTAKNILIV